MKMHVDLQKRFPIYYACPKCVAARLCGSAFLQNGLTFAQELDEGWKDTGGLVTCECPLRTDSASWKSLKSFIQLISVCNSCILPVNTRIALWSSSNLLLAIVLKVELWNFFNSFISLKLFSWASRKSQFCFNNYSRRSCWSRRWILLASIRSFHLIFVYFFCHSQPGICVFQSPLDTARICPLNNCSFRSCWSCDEVYPLERDEVLFAAIRSFHLIFVYFFCHSQPGICVVQSPSDSRRGFGPLSIQRGPNLCMFRFWPVLATGLLRSIVAFGHDFNNGLPHSFGHWRRRLTNSLLAGSDRLVLGMRFRAFHRLWHHRNRRPRGTVARGTVARSSTPDWTRRTSLWVGEVEKWILRNERRKLKMMKRSRKSERTLTSCMAMTMGWNETNTRTSWAMRCVQEMSVTTQNKDYEDWQHYAHAHVFVLCFVLFLWILVFTLSWVSDASTSSKMVSFVNCISPRIRNIKCKVLSFWML